MTKILKPQIGPQTQFLSSPADVCIYGGAAGGGKTYGLLLSALRYKNVKGFGCTIFRKNYNQIFAQGGLWDEACDMIGGIKGAYPRISGAEWQFTDKNGARVSKITFAHIEKDTDLEKWQGAQICAIGFDELTHFSERTFFYMLSRNRSTCGVTPYVKATCNPDADSWVAKFIEWWIDPDTGYPIPERSGKIRWMIRRNESIYWADRKEDLWEQFELKTPEEKGEPKSVTFIASSVQDNQELLKKNPGYLSNLKALSLIERERLLYGNWKIKPAAGLYFQRSRIGTIFQTVPPDVDRWARGWDLAATTDTENSKSACTAGVLIGKRKNGRYVVADVVNVRAAAPDVRRIIKATAIIDRNRYQRVTVRLPQDPGQAGKAQAQSYIKYLSGFNVKAIAESGSKETRAEPVSAQWMAGNFDIVAGDWNEIYLSQLENFPAGQLKDMVDATSSAFSELELANVLNIESLI